MIEKVNPSHPDKIADRIAGALVDLAYTKEKRPKVAVEVLIGHGTCTIISETSVSFSYEEVCSIVRRITNDKMIRVFYNENVQDVNLSKNQENEIRCCDNGIFKGVPLTGEQILLSNISRRIYDKFPSDGKYIIAEKELIICQSCCKDFEIIDILKEFPEVADYKITINPLGSWTGGISVDSGATNRKLGSDMADSITGGGLHGKDFSKSDVSINIYSFLKAQKTGKEVHGFCAIGDNSIFERPYSEIVEMAERFINFVGGFEKFAEWGLFDAALFEGGVIKNVV